ncbi:hypothetical protein CUT44_11260 [Streptomyces carminius]|uniref:DUF4259 domain-containing protein n=1 Tax=Streptomyces carminius TaxID=2665496 RepID=A0A2M8M0H1_9ACTN|nr:DUF4259 domain-containing protein [Streptomyces carminius]PJE96993.1 hypothetical protein CUT44_14515 [Streptomyces carminius]PJE97702.1 hypothetical protein CUT44_11260 [Streptomyces carminius]
MGAWDVGPFENDMAADFAHTLDETAPDKRESLVRSTLGRAVQARDYLESSEGEKAVAAAALVAAQCPGGEAISTGYGPKQALPAFAGDLRPLAVEALDRVVAEDSELAELWDEAHSSPKWQQGIGRLRAVLAPESGPREEAPSGV